jgi:O-antigen ligase
MSFDLNQKIIFITIPIILTSSIPFLLITGPFLPDLALSTCALLFFINSIKNSIFSYYKSRFFLFFILFYCILLFSSLNSDLIFLSLKTSLPYIRFGIFALSTWYLLDQDKNLINKIFNVTIFTFSLLIIDGFFQLFFGFNLLGWKMVDTPRISSFFGKEWVLGSYLARLMPLFFSCFIILHGDLKKSAKYLIYLIFILTEVLIFIAGERTSFFLSNLFIIYILILSKKFKKIRLYCWLLSILLILTISIFNKNSYTRIFITTADQIGFGSGKINIFSKEHEGHFISAYKMFLSNKILGIGPKLFREKCDLDEFKGQYSCSTHPHNTYMQLLAETGFLGFLCVFFTFLTLLFFSLKQLYYNFFLKKKLFTDYSLSLFSCLVITLWPFVPTGSFFNNWLNVIYYLPIGFLIWSLKRNKI